MSVEQYDENLLLGYIEGELTAEEIARVEAWVAEDAKLAGLLAAMRADRMALSTMPDPPTPEWLMDEVDRQLERAMLVDMGPRQFAETSIAQRHVMRRIVLGTAVAAMLMVVAGVVISSLTGVGGSPEFAMNGEPRVAETPDTPTDPDDPDAPAMSETETPTTPTEPETTPLPTPAVAAIAATEPADTPAIAKSGDEAPAVMPKPTPDTETPSTVATKTGSAEPAPIVAETDKPMTTPGTPGTSDAPGTPGAAPRPGEILAGSGAPRYADLLPAPPLKQPAPKSAPEARLPADDALYNARRIRLQPDLAQQMELRIVARDPDKVVTQITTFVNRASEPGAPATGPQGPQDPGAPKPSLTKADLQQAVAQILQQTESTPGRQYQLHVSTEQLPGLIAELQAAPGNAQVQLRPRNLLAVGHVPAPTPLKPEVTLTPAPWPTLAPDYRAILQQQIPQTPDKNKPDTGLITLPLIIQQQGDR